MTTRIRAALAAGLVGVLGVLTLGAGSADAAPAVEPVALRSGYWACLAIGDLGICIDNPFR